MNQFAFIDYQRPIGLKNDYRTSSYRGHIILDDAMQSRSKKANKTRCDAIIKNPMKEELISEQRRQYTRKEIPNVIRNPPVSSVKFMKSVEETHLSSAPKPLQELRSIYNTDFKRELQANAERPPALPVIRAVKNCDKLEIERSKPGYVKYLDTLATTSHLDYIPYTADQLIGIRAKDNITYWTWIQNENNAKYNVWPIKEKMCEKKITGSKCPARRNEFQNQHLPVPNTGFTTETKSNYVKPLNSIDLDFTCIRTPLISCAMVPVQKRTENSIYGSGERLEKFINSRSNKRYL